MSKIFDKKPFYVQMIRVKASSSRKCQEKTPPTKQTDLDILTGFDWFWRFEKSKSVPRASPGRRGVSSVWAEKLDKKCQILPTAYKTYQPSMTSNATMMPKWAWI